MTGTGQRKIVNPFTAMICHLKTTNKSGKFETLKLFGLLFSHWHVKGLSSKGKALKVDVTDRKMYCLQSRPYIFQPGNFTGLGSEGVKPHRVRRGKRRDRGEISALIKLPKAVGGVVGIIHCFVDFSLHPSSSVLFVCFVVLFCLFVCLFVVFVCLFVFCFCLVCVCICTVVVFWGSFRF